MYVSEEMEELNSVVKRIFDNGGMITDSKEYYRDFLDLIVEKTLDKIKVNQFKFLTSTVSANQGFVFDIIEVDFKVKSSTCPVNTTKEYIENPDNADNDKGPQLMDYLQEHLANALECTKVDIWLDVRAEGKNKRDVKIRLYNKREVPIPVDPPGSLPVPEVIISDETINDSLQVGIDKTSLVADVNKKVIDAEAAKLAEEDTSNAIDVSTMQAVITDTCPSVLIHDTDVYNFLTTTISKDISQDTKILVKDSSRNLYPIAAISYSKSENTWTLHVYDDKRTAGVKACEVIADYVNTVTTHLETDRPYYMDFDFGALLFISARKTGAMIKITKHIDVGDIREMEYLFDDFEIIMIEGNVVMGISPYTLHS
jgi:hypothetical protein